jgi:hypothetical protein
LLGFSDTVIGGRMTLSCVTELLTRHFGRGFCLGGRVDVKFTNRSGQPLLLYPVHGDNIVLGVLLADLERRLELS